MLFYNTATFLLKKSLNFCRLVRSGLGAELTGGNFWQGAVTCGIVAGLNHRLNKEEGPPRKVIKTKRAATIYYQRGNERGNLLLLPKILEPMLKMANKLAKNGYL